MLPIIAELIQYFENQDDKTDPTSLSHIYLAILYDLKNSILKNQLDSEKAGQLVFTMMRILDDSYSEFKESDIGKKIHGLALAINEKYAK
jgi:hypothetical protein